MAIFRGDDDILDPHADVAGEINPRLDAETVARFQNHFAAADDVRLLVHVHAEPVPGAVHEILAVPGIGDDLPRGGVHRSAGHPGPARPAPSHVRAIHDVVDLLGLRGGFADRHGARDVAVVAAEVAAEIHDQHLAVIDNRVVAEVVRFGGVRARRHDGERGDAAAFGHGIREHLGDLLFGQSRAELRQHLLKRFVGDAPGPAKDGDLVGRFDAHQLGQVRLAGLEKRSWQGVLHLQEHPGGHIGVDGDDRALQLPLVGKLEEEGERVLAVLPGSDLGDAGPRYLIGGQRRADHPHPAGTMHAHRHEPLAGMFLVPVQVAHRDRVLGDEAVDAVLAQHLRQSLNPGRIRRGRTHTAKYGQNPDAPAA